MLLFFHSFKKYLFWWQTRQAVSMALWRDGADAPTPPAVQIRSTSGGWAESLETRPEPVEQKDGLITTCRDLEHSPFHQNCFPNQGTYVTSGMFSATVPHPQSTHHKGIERCRGLSFLTGTLAMGHVYTRPKFWQETRVREILSLRLLWKFSINKLYVLTEWWCNKKTGKERISDCDKFCEDRTV